MEDKTSSDSLLKISDWRHLQIAIGSAVAICHFNPEQA
jgi:hypothetical protein